MTSPVAHNYGKAFIELIEEKKTLEITRSVAEDLVLYIKSPEWASFFNHPKVPAGIKKDLIRKILPPEAPQELINLLDLMIDRHREHLLEQTLETIIQLAIFKQGYEIIKVVSARPLTIPEQTAIKKELENLWNVQIYLDYRENPNLLGGIIIQRGDQLYDGSLTGQLNKIKDLLINI